MFKKLMFVMVMILGLSAAPRVLAGTCFVFPESQSHAMDSFPNMPKRICLNKVDHVQFGEAIAHFTFEYSDGRTEATVETITYLNDPYDTDDYPVQAQFVQAFRGQVSDLRADVILDMDQVGDLTTASLSVHVIDEKALTLSIVPMKMDSLYQSSL